MNGYPLRVRADLDGAGRWLWLIKWLLLIPHYIVLAFLWLAFIILTVVAYIAVLVTGHYPKGIFMFNVGVMRWSWRVAFYGYRVLGTDRYPPFTLAEVPDYPAGLTVDQVPSPRRWLPLVAWLLAIPQIVLVCALNGNMAWQFSSSGDDRARGVMMLSPVVIGVLFAAVALLFTARYPRGLFDLLVGIARWVLRVVAYVALLTEQYPPFRLDQGGREPDNEPVR